MQGFDIENDSDGEEPLDEDVRQLMEDYQVDDDIAERAQELIDEEGIDEEEAIEIAENE